MLSETKRTAIFILNRNGYDESGLREIIPVLLEAQFSIEDVEVLWVSIFGKPPDRPQAIITLSSEIAAEELCNAGKITFSTNDGDLIFEMSKAVATKQAEDDEDPLLVFVKGIPTNGPADQIKSKLHTHFSQVATPTSITLPKTWKEKKIALMSFKDKSDAQMIIRCCAQSKLEGKTMFCSYAKYRE